MIDKINDLLKRVEAFAPTTAAEVEEFRIKILGKKGELTALMDEFKSVPAEQKRELGQKINALKQAILAKIETLREAAASKVSDDAKIEDITVQRPLGCSGCHILNFCSGGMKDHPF